MGKKEEQTVKKCVLPYNVLIVVVLVLCVFVGIVSAGNVNKELSEEGKSRFAEPNLWVGTGGDIVPGTSKSAKLIAEYYSPSLYRGRHDCPDKVYYRVVKGIDSWAKSADAYLIQYFAYWDVQPLPVYHQYDYEPIFIWVRNIGEKPYRVAYDRCDWADKGKHYHQIHRTHDCIDPEDGECLIWSSTNDKAYYPYGKTSHYVNVNLSNIVTSLKNNWDGNHVKLSIAHSWHTFDTKIYPGTCCYDNYPFLPLTDEALINAYNLTRLFGPEPFKYDVSDPFKGVFWDDQYHRDSEFPTISGDITSAVVNNEILTVKVSMFYDNTGAGGSPGQHLRGLWEDRFNAKISTDTGDEDIGIPKELDEQSPGEYILEFDVSGMDINSVLHLEVRDNVYDPDDPCDSCELSKDITFVLPEIQLTPSGRYFYDVVVGQCSQPYPFILENIGTGTATGSVYLTDSHADQFTITTVDKSFSLAEGATKTFTVEFCPKSVGAKTARLYAEGTNCNDDSSLLGGNGIPPEEPEIQLTPSSRYFYDVAVGQCSQPYPFTLENIGTGTATGSVYLTDSYADQFTITTVDKSFSLPEGDTKVFYVEFCPSSVGAKTATLFAKGTNCNDDSSLLGGNGVPSEEPEIQLTPSSHDFGNVEVGECSLTSEFTLENIGTGTATGSVHLTGSHADQFTIMSGDGSFSLTEDATKTITVEFCPDSVGAKTVTLYAEGTNCNDDSSTLEGTGFTPEEPEIQLTPLTHDFGNVKVGECSSPPAVFTLENIGTGTATGSVYLTGSHVDQFTIISGDGSFSLAKGATKTITVEFCPGSVGAKTVTLYAEGTNCNDDSSTLEGTGFTPEEPEIQLTPLTHDFGNVKVGQCSSPPAVFTLENIGTGTATGSVYLTGSHVDQFTIISGDGSFSLAKGATKTITVEFCPGSVGAKTATLYAEGTNCNDDSSTLEGTGFTPEQPEIQLTPPSHDFGNVKVGQCSSPPAVFTLENIGTGTATGSVHLTGSHVDQFTIISGDGSFSLAKDATKTITVEFCPGSVGAKTATLYAEGTNCNDDSSTLEGTGFTPEQPEIQLTPPSHDFGNVLVGQCSPTAKEFTIENIGTGTATGSVHLTGSHVDQFTIISGDGSFSLTKDATKTITVEFCPKSVGAKTATLYAACTNCEDDSSSLSGTGVQPEIELSPPSHDFGNVQVGECSPTAKEFTLKNIGTGTATGSVDLTGSHADQFTIISGDGSFSLTKDATKTITVEFCPKSVGAKTATLYAACTNCEDDSSSLSGTGVQPEIELSPPSHDFGNVQVGECSPTAKEFTLKNIGTATATGSVHLTGSHADQFTITTVDKSFSLAEGDTKTFTVEFCPGSVGAKTATLYAACTNCEDDSSSLSGTCVQPPVADANGPYSGVIEYIAVPITFDGTGSYDPDGTIIKYEWDLDNDGKFDDAVGATPTVSFTAPYSGNISLKVTDNNGATDTDTTTLTITKHSPPPNGHGGLLTPPEQPQCYSGTSTIQGSGYFTIDERIQDWATAIDTLEHIEGTGEFEMASKKVLDQAANPLDFYDPNFYHKKTMQFQGNATNRLINRETFESPGIFGGTGTRINEYFDVSMIQKDESSSIKTISAPGGSGQSHSFATMDDFSGIWGIDSDWQKICQKKIAHHQMFIGNFSVQKDLTFEREIIMP